MVEDLIYDSRTSFVYYLFMQKVHFLAKNLENLNF